MGWLIRVSTFGQQLFQGCLSKSMADSCHEMLAKCQPSGSMMATADDTESAADVLMPIGKERCSSPVASARCHRLQTTHLPVYTMSSQMAMAASQHCLHTAGHSATVRCPVRTSPPAAGRRLSRPVSNYMRVSNFGRFWRQVGSQFICESTCARVCMVREFSRKIGLAPCKENCIVH